jgi:ferredoxin
MMVIHPEECIDCGACIPECPVEAIFTEEDVPPQEGSYVDVNAAIVRGVEHVDAAVEALLAAASSTQGKSRGEDAWRPPSSKNGS